MKTKRVAVLLFGLMLLASARSWAEDDKATQADIASLQGEWTMVSGSADGLPMPEPMLSQAKRVCKGNDWVGTPDEGEDNPGSFQETQDH